MDQRREFNRKEVTKHPLSNDNSTEHEGKAQTMIKHYETKGSVDTLRYQSDAGNEDETGFYKRSRPRIFYNSNPIDNKNKNEIPGSARALTPESDTKNEALSTDKNKNGNRSTRAKPHDNFDNTKDEEQTRDQSGRPKTETAVDEAKDATEYSGRQTTKQQISSRDPKSGNNSSFKQVGDKQEMDVRGKGHQVTDSNRPLKQIYGKKDQQSSTKLAGDCNQPASFTSTADSGFSSYQGTLNSNFCGTNEFKKDVNERMSEKVQLLDKEIYDKNSRIVQLEKENNHSSTRLQELERKLQESEEKNCQFNKLHEQCQFMLETLTEDLENKRSSWWQTISSLGMLSGKKRKFEESDLLNNIKLIWSYSKTLELKLNDKEIEITNLSKKFDLKKKKQLESLKEADKKLIAATNEFNIKERSYQGINVELSERIVTAEETIKRLIKGTEGKEVEIEDLSKKLKKQAAKIEELTAENCDLCNQLHEKENKVQDLCKESQELMNHLYDLSAEVDQKQKTIESLMYKKVQTETSLRQERQKLENVANTVKTQERGLYSAKTRFISQIRSFSENSNKYWNHVSLEENEKQVEQQLIDSALEKIRKIQQTVDNYKDEVRTFEGSRENKTYLHLKEMLLRAVESLDKIKSEKKEKILVARRKSVTCIKELLDELEMRVQ